MNQHERDTKFQASANLLFPKVSKLFFTMYARISELRPIEEIDVLEDEIKTLLAQYGYDLVYHALDHVEWSGMMINGLSYMDDIPDLTERPVERSD